MQIPVNEAKEMLPDLVRRAEAGEEIMPTHDGRSNVKLAPVPSQRKLTADERRRVIDRIRAAAAGKRKPGAGTARSQDFLYGDDGLPK